VQSRRGKTPLERPKTEYFYILLIYNRPANRYYLYLRGEQGVKKTKRKKGKIIAYWVTTIFGPASFVIGGILHLCRADQPMAMLSHLGYPPYFAYILGTWKILGAIAIVIPRFPLLKEWAYAGFFFELTSAVISHAFSGDPLFSAGPAQMAPPLVFLALLAASWTLRPPSRRLLGT
jgi:uncharacterized membrane protein YphA (DoxX/SURF4 family)